MSDAEVAVAAARAGAAVVRARYGQPVERYAKSGNDFATAADIEAETAILDALRAARPDDAVLGEETGRTGDTAADRLWLVDPLCGTLNFAAQTPLVAVNVALRTGDTVTATAVADPFTEEVFWTDGHAAHLRLAGTDRPLRPAPDARLVDVNIDPPFANGPGFRAVRLLNDVAFTQRFGGRVTSTTLALAWVAAGRRAAYVTDGDMRDNVTSPAPSPCARPPAASSPTCADDPSTPARAACSCQPTNPRTTSCSPSWANSSGSDGHLPVNA